MNLIRAGNLLREPVTWLHGFTKWGLGDSIKVFCYHGVVEKKRDVLLERNFHLLSDFRSHLRLLRRFRVLSLEELADELLFPAKRKTPAAVITFDDGYANNLLACDLLSAFQLPGAVFVSTGEVGREHSIRAVELSLLLLHGRAERVEALGSVWQLTDRRYRQAAFDSIRRPMKLMSANRQRETMDSLRRQFPAGETRRLLSEFPSLQMLTWDEVLKLGSEGFTIGSHGVNHEIHHKTQPEAVRRGELTQSKAEIERRLGEPCEFFAFPNGDSIPSSANEVREAGFKLAFTTRPGAVKPGVDPYLLPRLSPASSHRDFRNSFH